MHTKRTVIAHTTPNTVIVHSTPNTVTAHSTPNTQSLLAAHQTHRHHTVPKQSLLIPHQTQSLLTPHQTHIHCSFHTKHTVIAHSTPNTHSLLIPHQTHSHCSLFTLHETQSLCFRNLCTICLMLMLLACLWLGVCSVFLWLAVCSVYRMLNFITKQGASSAQTLGVIGELYCKLQVYNIIFCHKN